MASTLFQTFKYRLFYFWGWATWTLLQAGLLYWLGFNFNTALADSFVSNSILAIACWSVSSNLGYYRPGQGLIVYLISWCVAVAAICTGITYFVIPHVFLSTADYITFLDKSLPIRFGFGFLMIGWMALLSLFWYNQEDQKEKNQRQADAERLAREAELFKLRQQLQPHFLFNSLNSINALVGSQPQAARKMVLQLSDFLRSTLKKEDEDLINVAEELQHLELYLDIEKVRFGHRLETQITCEEDCHGLQIPPMLLQPIVENAIKFGLYDTIGHVIITIEVSKQDNLLQIIVKNPYDPETANPNKGTGFGLTGIQRRLYLLFARTDLLQTQALENTFTTTLKIPQSK